MKETLRRIAPHFARESRGLIGIVVLALTTAALGAVEPLVMKSLFDALASRRGFAPFLVALLSLLLLREGLSAALDWLTWRVRIAANQSMLCAAVDRLHALPLAYHQRHGVGALMTRIDRGIQGSVNAFSEVAFHALPALTFLALSAAVMLRLDARLSLVVLAFAPLPAVVGAHAAKEQTTRERSLMRRWTDIYARFHEVLAGIQVVKSFAMEDQEKRRFLDDVRDTNALVVRGVRRDAATAAVKSACITAARVAAIAYGAALVLRGEITLGTLVAFLSYAVALFAPVQSLTGIYQTVRRGAVAVDTLAEILDADDALADADDAVTPERLRGEVEFDRVSFDYLEGRRVVDEVCFKASPGETIALVGPSGAGKTTLMVLLQRLYEASSGSVRIDGLDVRRYKQRELRKHIGVVLQEGLLFSDSIRANIAFGRPEASLDEIVAAARAANAHDFIARLPEGYDTKVGERGASLSGGERQRIAIARALLKDPEILILDEATSALDAETEAAVQQALERLMVGRTTFIVAHRLSTVVSADRILVFQDGRIVETGTHAELVQRDGYYASLVDCQLRGLRDSSPYRAAS